ncbi:hypothetical protein TWF281_009066 [Arthrobotrys megalospora]
MPRDFDATPAKVVNGGRSKFKTYGLGHRIRETSRPVERLIGRRAPKYKILYNPKHLSANFIDTSPRPLSTTDGTTRVSMLRLRRKDPPYMQLLVSW